MFQQQQNLGRRFGTSKMHLSPKRLWLLSVLRRWFCCCWFVVVFCFCSMFCCALLCVHCSFAIISMGKIYLVALPILIFLVSHDWCMALPHDGMGLSAVCDCVFTHWLFLFLLFLFMIILPVPSFCLACGSMINLHENMRTGRGQTHDPLLTSLQGVIRGPTLFLH